jgi:hypothetical protein
VQVSESLHAIASLQERERTLGEESRFYQANTVPTYSPLIGAADQDSVNLDPDPGFLTKKSICRYFFLGFYAVLRVPHHFDADPDPACHFDPDQDSVNLNPDPGF